MSHEPMLMLMQAAPSGGAAAQLFSFFPFIAIFVIFYFLMIRPQQRRNRELQRMQSSLGPGAEVMTGSGIYGTVTDIDEEEGTLGLEVSPGVTIRFARGAVARVITSGEVDEDDDVQEPVDEVDHETDVTPNPIIERKD